MQKILQMIEMPGELNKRVKILVFLNCVIAVICFVLGIVLLIIGTFMKPEETEIVLNILKDGFFDLKSQADVLSNVFIAVGVFSFIAGIFNFAFGLYSAHNKEKVLTIFYAVLAVLVLVSFVMKITGFVLWNKFNTKIGGQLVIKTQLVGSLHKNFVNDSISGGNDISNEWNKMFMFLDCCAVNPVESTTNDFDTTPWCTTKGECQSTNAEIPKACCVGVTETNYTSAPSSCYADVQSGTYNKKGCFQALKELEEELEEKNTAHTTTVLVLEIILFVLEVSQVILVISICRSSNEA